MLRARNTGTNKEKFLPSRWRKKVKCNQVIQDLDKCSVGIPDRSWSILPKGWKIVTDTKGSGKVPVDGDGQ